MDHVAFHLPVAVEADLYGNSVGVNKRALVNDWTGLLLFEDAVACAGTDEGGIHVDVAGTQQHVQNTDPVDAQVH